MDLTQNIVGTDAEHSLESFSFKNAQQLFELPKEAIRYTVEALFPSSGMSAVVAKPKVGKSTLARQLAVDVAQGEPFLGRKTEQGAVLLIVLEEKESEVADHLLTLGMQRSDPLHLFCGSTGKGALQKLEQSFKSIPDVKLVVIDPIFKFVRVSDSNDYAKVNAALDPLLNLARQYGPHIVCIHHMKKVLTEDPMDAMLGSTAIAGGVDTIAMMLCDGKGQRTIGTRQRYGPSMPETQIRFDPISRRMSLGITTEEDNVRIGEAVSRRIQSEMLDFIATHPGTQQSEIYSSITGNTRLLRQTLKEITLEGKVVRSGTGEKCDPFCYDVNIAQEIESL